MDFVLLFVIDLYITKVCIRPSDTHLSVNVDDGNIVKFVSPQES